MPIPPCSRLAVAIAAALATAAPAAASTLPPLDYRAGQTVVAIGFPDLNVDHALSDRLAAGLTVLYIPPIIEWSPARTQPDGTVIPASRPFWLAAGPRVTYRLAGEADGTALGVSTTAGILGPQWNWWVQPSLVGSLSLWGVVRLRGSLGPVITSSFLANPWGFGLWPNAEMAIRVLPDHELTLGGNALVGWRGRF